MRIALKIVGTVLFALIMYYVYMAINAVAFLGVVWILDFNWVVLVLLFFLLVGLLNVAVNIISSLAISFVTMLLKPYLIIALISMIILSLYYIIATSIWVWNIEESGLAMIVFKIIVTIVLVEVNLQMPFYYLSYYNEATDL